MHMMTCFFAISGISEIIKKRSIQLIKLNNMKNLIYISLIALLSSCSGSQLFLEARTTYNVPLNHDGQINTKIVINGIK